MSNGEKCGYFEISDSNNANKERILYELDIKTGKIRFHNELGNYQIHHVPVNSEEGEKITEFMNAKETRIRKEDELEDASKLVKTLKEEINKIID